MITRTIRDLLRHALPILVAQLASVGMMLVDTSVLGHVSSVDLAAVAIGGGVHISIVFALVGVLQAVAPVVAHLHGARRDGEVAKVLQQGLWLAVLLSIPGVLLLLHPDSVLGLSTIDATVGAKVRQYLSILAISLPSALLYRTFYAFCNALGKPRILMVIGLICLALHAVLAWGLAQQGWLGAPLGVAGCAWSNVIISWLACVSAVLYLALGPLARRYQPFAHWHAPQWAIWRELLRLGLPMGISNLVEITAFTLVSLFIAPLGARVVAGHRIVANLSALSYMLPLSIAIATMAALGQAVGARNVPMANLIIKAGLLLAGVSSCLAGLLLWVFAGPIVAAYTDDASVRLVALALISYIAVYQFFDAVQTVAGHCLRAYRFTLLPMLIQTVCFWGFGLAGGYWLCYDAANPMGVAGFWLAAVLSLVAAAALLLPLLKYARAAWERSL